MKIMLIKLCWVQLPVTAADKNATISRNIDDECMIEVVQFSVVLKTFNKFLFNQECLNLGHFELQYQQTIALLYKL